MGKDVKPKDPKAKPQASAQPEEPFKNANPGDTATTKGLFDDGVVQAFEDAGFPEDHTMSNLKLFLGTLACVLALVAQFWPHPLKPMPFPESRPLLMICCATYFAISFALQAIAVFIEKETILYTKPPAEASPFHSALKGYRIKVSTRLPRFSLDYTLRINLVDGKGVENEGEETILKLTDYFEENGTFHEDFFMEDIDAIIAELGNPNKKAQ